MVKYWIVLLILLLLAPIKVLAGESLQVDQVVVEGQRRVERAYIEAVLTVTPGQTVTVDQIDQDIRAIFATGRFKDVAARREERNGRQVLVYQVEERPLMREVVFTGNHEIKKDKLGELLQAKKVDFYRPRFLREGVKAIKQAYVQEGYYATEVEPQVDINDRHEATVTFAIDEGEQVYVTDIRFEGNTVFKAKELKRPC
jgi:outer membrane protein insertion porin family